MITISAVTKKQIPELAKLYKKAFKNHNIFRYPLKEIEDYVVFMNKQEREHGGGFIVAMVEDKKYKNHIVGATLIKKIDASKDKHERWRIAHLAVHPTHQGKGYGSQLIESIRLDAHNAVEDKFAKSIKLEAHTIIPDLFRLQGFRVEGKLEDHYRLGETTIALGLTIK